MPNKTKKISNNKIYFTIAILISLLSSWAGGYHFAQINKNEPISASKRILNATGDTSLSSGLKEFLIKDIEQSDKRQECMPYGGLSYSVLAQTDTQAKLMSRCSAPFAIDAVIINGHWDTTNITNNFPNYQIPLCSYVKKYSLSKMIRPICFVDSTTLGNSVPVIVENTTN